MKSFMLIVLFILSLPAIASFNEVECEAKLGDKEISLEVEQSFPSGSAFKRARLTVDENGSQTSYDYTVTARYSQGFGRLTYQGSGLRLEVDLWPDQFPRWGRNYRSTISSSDLGNTQIKGADCTFTNAQ